MAPVETSTGVVLPILHPDFDHRDRANNNLHHPHFYGKEYETDSIAIRAVRYSRQQLVSKPSHENYHHFIDGTKKPETPEDAFRITLLNAAKYIPPLGVGMRAGFPEVMEVSRRQRRQLRQMGVFQYEKTRLIKRALMDYTTSRELQPDDGYLIEEFIDLFGRADHLDDRSKRRLNRVGKRLVYVAIDAAVSPVEPHYQQARQAQLFAQGAPETAFRAIRRFIKGREPNYFDALGRNLIADLS